MGQVTFAGLGKSLPSSRRDGPGLCPVLSRLCDCGRVVSPLSADRAKPMTWLCFSLSVECTGAMLASETSQVSGVNSRLAVVWWGSPVSLEEAPQAHWPLSGASRDPHLQHSPRRVSVFLLVRWWLAIFFSCHVSSLVSNTGSELDWAAPLLHTFHRPCTQAAGPHAQQPPARVFPVERT